MKTAKLLLALFSFMGVIISLAANTTDGPDMRPMVCIEKDKIQNRTDNKRANFIAMVDRLNHELVQCGLFRVIEMQNLADALKDNEKFAAVADDGGKGTAIKTPGFFIRMNILRYGISSERQVDRLYNKSKLSEVATVELILLVVDMRTSQTVKSVNIKRQATASVSAVGISRKVGNYREQALQEACQYVCQDIVKELIKLTPFYVMDVEGASIMIDAPNTVAPAGSLFDIFKTGKAIRNRRTGKVTRRETKICTIRITVPGEDGCKGEIVRSYVNVPVKVDYIARFASTPAVAAPAAPAAPIPAEPSAANPF